MRYGRFRGSERAILVAGILFLMCVYGMCGVLVCGPSRGLFSENFPEFSIHYHENILGKIGRGGKS